MKKVKVLIACEESQAVTIEMRKLGIEAYSCDLEPCSGGHPEWHLQQDVIPLLEENWDMIIAFPPCTYLCTTGNKWFKPEFKTRFPDRQKQRENAIKFFMNFVNSKCERIAIENPIGIMSTVYKKPDQIIQPWQFGHGETKATCLWLKNLPLLQPTNIIDGRNHSIWKMPPSKERAKLRSKTFPGIAKAMAVQWGRLLKN